MISEFVNVKKFSEFYNTRLSEYVKSYISKEMDAKIRRRVYDLEDKITLFQRDEVFVNLVVAGEYNSGKSSVINSILGEKIIPVGPEPMTLAVSIFKYGERRKVVIEFDDETFREISHEEFDKLKHTSKDAVGFDVSKIRYIHFYYPDPYLSKVRIIDTPGFSTTTEAGDDAKTREAILTKTDVLLWIFNINNGTIKNSELTILRDLFEKVFNTAEADELTGELSITKKKRMKFFCVVNRVDEKGNIESQQVRNVMAEFEKELAKCGNFKADSLIPYSAKKIHEYKAELAKENAAIEKLADILRSAPPQKIEAATASESGGPKRISISSNGAAGPTVEVFDLGPWAAPLEKIKAELEGIRANSRNIMEHSILNDLYSLYKNIRIIIDFIIANKLQKDIDRHNGEINFIIQSLKELKTIFRERIGLYKKEFNQKVWPVLAKFFFRIEQVDGRKIVRLTGNHKLDEAKNKVGEQIFAAFDIRAQIREEATKICDMLESYDATREYLLLLDKSRKLIGDFETEYSANAANFTDALFEKLPKFFMIDKAFPADRSDENIIAEAATELAAHMTSEFVFSRPLWKIEEYYDDLVVLLKIVYLLATSDLKSKIEELTALRNEQLNDLVRLEEFLGKQ